MAVRVHGVGGERVFGKALVFSTKAPPGTGHRPVTLELRRTELRSVFS